MSKIQAIFSILCVGISGIIFGYIEYMAGPHKGALAVQQLQDDSFTYVASTNFYSLLGWVAIAIFCIGLILPIKNIIKSYRNEQAK